MQDQKGGGSNSGPPSGAGKNAAEDARTTRAEAAAARRNTISPHLYNNQSYAENSRDALEHHKIRQQRAQQNQQAASPSKPREDTARAQAGTKEVSDSLHRQRNQPGRYRELQSAAQVQQNSNGNKGGRSGL
jgi:hypothetical protein